MTERLWEVPSSWEWTVIKELGDIVSGATPSTKVRDYWDGDVIWFAPSDLTGYKQKFIARGAKTLTEEGLANSSARIMPSGSVMFSSRAPVGYVAITSVPAATNQGFKSVVPYTGIFNEYLYHYLKASKHMAEQRATGTTFKELSGAAFGVLPAPLPPTNEQRRIVEKIEAMFDEIDAGIQSLLTARNTLGLYRQSLLKSAFEGRLTAEWRATNADKLEDPQTLLARIQTERDARYKAALDARQDALAAWRAGGEEGKKPAKPRKAKDQAPLTKDQIAELPLLPAAWVWVELGHLSWSVKDGPHFSPKYTEHGIPFISGGNIRPSGIDFDTAKYISPELHEELSQRCKPELGDVLYTKGGTTGIARVNTYDFDFNVWVHVAVLKITETTLPFYLQNALNSPFCHSQAQKLTHGVGNQDLGLTRMVNIRLPLCSPAEQAEIVRRLDARLEAADALEAETDAALTRADALRQSILKKAFSGQLVPQDPEDEPAATLLERIKAERATSSKYGRKRRVAV
jgi:type I restriction enzyme S subunit